MGASKDRSEKEAKKEKKAKRAEADGVSKSKSDKKEKKAKKEKLASAVEEHIKAEVEDAKEKKQKKSKKADGEGEKAVESSYEGDANAQLVPFAIPMAADRVGKKVIKAVKLAAKTHRILRGVKEVEKGIRKYGKHKTLAFSGPQKHNGVVIIAADIWPQEIIMHFPAYCEDNGIQYLFVPSRKALGEAANTQRTTSVVLLVPEVLMTDAQKAKGNAKKADEDDVTKYLDVFNEIAETAGAVFKAEVEPWIKGIHRLQMTTSTIAV